MTESPRGLVTIDDRGQAHTLEAVAGSIMMLASVLFALQVTAVTPLTASTASQHIENQQAGIGEGLLDGAAENGTLKPTVLLWNNSEGQPHFTGDDGVYTLGGPPTVLGANLNETFVDRGIAFDLSYQYIRPNGETGGRNIVQMGTPSDNSVSASRTIAIYDDDPLYDPGDEPQDMTVQEADLFRGDAFPDSGLYTIVEVRITIWRM